LQFAIDMSSPISLVEDVKAAVEDHIRLHSSEFSKKHKTTLKDASDPFKLHLQVSFEYTHPGECGTLL
jgi:hypothetical protein